MTASASAKTVLYVEDNPSMQKLVRAVLEPIEGLTVETAVDGFEAVDIAGANTPDLVLLDEGLPDMSGSTTLLLLRKMEGLEDVRVIFLTGSTDSQVHEKLIGLGADDILVKPCPPRLLLHAISLVLNGERRS